MKRVGTAVIKTWVPLNAPDTVSQDLAPLVFKEINKPRSDSSRDGGLVIIYPNHLHIKMTSLSFVPTSCAVLVMKLVIGAKLFTLANIYRLPRMGIIQFILFIDALSDVDDVLSVHRRDRWPFNYLGWLQLSRDVADFHRCFTWYMVVMLQSRRYERQTDSDAFGLSQLDLTVESENAKYLSNSSVVSVSFSDHSLVKA